MPASKPFSFIIELEEAGLRFDLILARRFPEVSRSTAARLIRDGTVRTENTIRKPGYRVRDGERVSGQIVTPAPVELIPEPLPLEILHEDDHILVINKAPGMVVYPAPGHFTGTLVNALLQFYPDSFSRTPGDFRPGIVHRLDKDTSGILVAARTDAAHQHLFRQFKKRLIQKTYIGFVYGEVSESTGSIMLPVGRHGHDRKKMTAKATSLTRARQAFTGFRRIRQYAGVALMEFDLKTGRTHQIRVHCAAMGHPIVGDPLYGPKRPLTRFVDNPSAAALIRTVPRQLLHARRIEFDHPGTNRRMQFTAPLPPDMKSFQEQIESLNPP